MPIQVLSDLIWVANSQPLLEPMATIGRIEPHDIDADHLGWFVREQTDHRVGRYFERLVLYWLQHVRKVDIVCESKQIRVGKRTIGEIDFIFRDEAGRLTHWETAVKFYLYDGHALSQESLFIGPNSADNFEKKTAKILSSQLALSEEYFPEVEIRQPYVKGRVFYHPDQPKPATLPLYMAPDHLEGIWIRAAELEWLNKSQGSVYRVQRKPLWLTANPVIASDPCSMSSSQLIAQLRQHFADDGHPVLVSEHATTADPSWIFVVPDYWPQKSPS